MVMSKHSGSCLCGQVRFEIRGELSSFYLCHCGRCRKGTGSAHAANLFSTTAEIDWRSGGDLVREYALPGTRHVRSFCPICGSAVPSVQMNGGLLVVPAGSLDSDVTTRPAAHIWCASRAGWDHDLDAVPELPGMPVPAR